MTDKYIYNGKIAKIDSADGMSGVLISVLGGGYKFRVYNEDHTFIDYEIRHDDLSVTIDKGALASFYVIDEDLAILDHSPSVLGLQRSVQSSEIGFGEQGSRRRT
jgi:hypothetical protein